MSTFPFVAWALVLIGDIIVYIAVAKRIEKSGLARLGATGKLFGCEPDPAKLEAELKEIEAVK